MIHALRIPYMLLYFVTVKKKKEIKYKTAVGVGSKRIELDVDFIISFL